MCDAIVAKCLTGRPKTVEKAQAAFMLWLELEAVEVFLVSDFMVFGKDRKCVLVFFFFLNLFYGLVLECFYCLIC